MSNLNTSFYWKKAIDQIHLFRFYKISCVYGDRDPSINHDTDSEKSQDKKTMIHVLYMIRTRFKIKPKKLKSWFEPLKSFINPDSKHYFLLLQQQGAVCLVDLPPRADLLLLPLLLSHFQPTLMKLDSNHVQRFLAYLRIKRIRIWPKLYKNKWSWS